jgi:lysyl-tRNA synthetase class 1
MSGSTGTVITLDEALGIYQPEVLMWIFARLPPNRAFDLVLDRQIFQMYDEYDRAAQETSEVSEDTDRKSVELARVEGRRVLPVPFRQIASFAGIVRGNRKALEDILARLGTPWTEAEFGERLDKAETWLAVWAPEEDVRLLAGRRDDYFQALPANRKGWIDALRTGIAQGDLLTVESANELLYGIPQADGDPRALQKTFFKDVYQLLFGRDSGPRLATFFAAVPKEDYTALIDFTVH